MTRNCNLHRIVTFLHFEHRMIGVNSSEVKRVLGLHPMEDPHHLHILQHSVRDHGHMFLGRGAERSDTTRERLSH